MRPRCIRVRLCLTLLGLACAAVSCGGGGAAPTDASSSTPNTSTPLVETDTEPSPVSVFAGAVVLPPEPPDAPLVQPLPSEAPAGVLPAPDPAVLAQLTAAFERLSEAAPPASAQSHTEPYEPEPDGREHWFAAEPEADAYGRAVIPLRGWLRGDYDGSGVVDARDLNVLAMWLGQREGGYWWPLAQQADGNRDGEVSIADLAPLGAGKGRQLRRISVQYRRSPDEPWVEAWRTEVRAPVDPPKDGYPELSFNAASPFEWRVGFADRLKDDWGFTFATPTVVTHNSPGQNGPRIVLSHFHEDEQDDVSFVIYRDSLTMPIGKTDTNGWRDDGAAPYSGHVYWVRTLRDGMLSPAFGGTPGRSVPWSNGDWTTEHVPLIFKGSNDSAFDIVGYDNGLSILHAGTQNEVGISYRLIDAPNGGMQSGAWKQFYSTDLNRDVRPGFARIGYQAALAISAHGFPDRIELVTVDEENETWETFPVLTLPEDEAVQRSIVLKEIGGRPCLAFYTYDGDQDLAIYVAWSKVPHPSSEVDWFVTKFRSHGRYVDLEEYGGRPAISFLNYSYNKFGMPAYTFYAAINDEPTAESDWQVEEIYSFDLYEDISRTTQLVIGQCGPVLISWCDFFMKVSVRDTAGTWSSYSIGPRLNERHELRAEAFGTKIGISFANTPWAGYIELDPYTGSYKCSYLGKLAQNFVWDHDFGSAPVPPLIQQNGRPLILFPNAEPQYGYAELLTGPPIH